MGQYFSGQHGRIFASAAGVGSASPIGSIRSWSINQSMDVLETTTMGATDRTLIAGVRSYTGSATLIYYQENNSNVKLMANQTFITGGRNDYNSDTYGQNSKPSLSYLILRCTDGSDNYDLQCYAYITGLSVTCTVGEVVTAEITFEGHGLPYRNNLIT